MTNRETVSDATRSDTWGMLLDLERQVRYYLKLADRYMLWYRSIRFILLFGIIAEAAAVYFLSAAPPVALWTVAGIGAAALAGITVFDAATNWAERAANLRAVHLLCDDLNTEATRLWRDIEANRVDDREAEKRYAEIMERWAKATRMATVEIHERDNLRAAKEANEIVTGRYAR